MDDEDECTVEVDSPEWCCRGCGIAAPSSGVLSTEDDWGVISVALPNGDGITFLYCSFTCAEKVAEQVLEFFVDAAQKGSKGMLS